MIPGGHPYHRSLAPMMWVFAGLAGIELIVVHFLVALWDWRVALVFSLVSLAGVVWLVRAILSFRRLPVLIGQDRVLRLRAGHLSGIDVPLDEIAAIRSQWESDAVKGRGVLNLAPIAYPNLLIDLRSPVQRRRRVIRSVAHRFDDPAAFRVALESAMDSGGQAERTA